MKKEITYFERIFTIAEPIYNGYNLGDSLSEDIIQKLPLPNSMFYTYSILTKESKINSIELEIHIENKAKAKEIIECIIEKYNILFSSNKPYVNFVSWTSENDKNLPIEIVLIYEKKLNSITLDIGYKSQR